MCVRVRENVCARARICNTLCDEVHIDGDGRWRVSRSLASQTNIHLLEIRGHLKFSVSSGEICSAACSSGCRPKVKERPSADDPFEWSGLITASLQSLVCYDSRDNVNDDNEDFVTVGEDHDDEGACSWLRAGGSKHKHGLRFSVIYIYLSHLTLSTCR